MRRRLHPSPTLLIGGANHGRGWRRIVLSASGLDVEVQILEPIEERRLTLPPGGAGAGG